ncbi:P-loop containing nucleoside triphosphate hydrolase protein [Mytilinidion resinicola]|uniref:Signal recognition particle receptor subunit beta n=1 Tax=Mytilinidion resinicola TaxID=574789 RepID=A0A6A6Y9W0_9PEZI|nr:P-loop containing nucleoside triphosphate hydrolase protein [Mytilinidion resinicola]KAF2805612.1 P-loop containing nucleoside triphosphate hydrolase protein [Mytilinidion resinicola]
MAWHDADSWLTLAFAPHPGTLALALLVVITLPILLHAYIYRRRAPDSLPTFLLIGPSSAGKTSLLTLLSHGTPSATHTSSTPTAASLALPITTTPASSRYRSNNDPSADRARKFRLLDTPGHGKLRHYALSTLAKTGPGGALKGIIFVLDAAALGEDAGAAEAGEYLHDILLLLQKRHTGNKTSKGPTAIPVLVAANKMDLFTALPESLVKIRLEKAVEEVRKTRGRALKDSGIELSAGDGEEEEREGLADGYEGAFNFKMLEDSDIEVKVAGGSVKGDKGEGADVQEWWGWVGEQL